MSDQAPNQASNRMTNVAYVLILLGALLLVARLGWFDLTRLLGVLRYWPVLVIAVGVDMLTGGKRRLLVYGAGVAAVVILSLTGGGIVAQPASTVQVAQELQGARSADVHVVASLAELHLSGSSQAQLLASGTLGQHSGEQVGVDYVLRGDHGQFSAVSQGFRSTFMGFRRAVPWDLTLTGRVPISLSVETGVGDSNLDLRQLQLEQLVVNAGVGSTTLHLPQGGGYAGSIDGGIGGIEVRVPRSVDVRIEVDTGIGTVNVANHFARNGNVYTSPGYATSAQPVDLSIDAGIGTVRILAVD